MGGIRCFRGITRLAADLVEDSQLVKPTVSVAGRPQPAAWGKDQLSAHLQDAHQNRLATFANKPEDFVRLQAIDGCSATITRSWFNPRPVISALLLIRAHGAFRSACEVTIAGQTVETFIMIRALLESVGYAAHISLHPRLSEVWLRRHDNSAAKRAAKAEFTITKIRQSISTRDRHAAERFQRLYDDSIDFGGHPNERAITSNLVKNERNGAEQLEQVLLHGDGPALDHAFISVARAGLLALDILQIPFSARFELLGVRERMLGLRTGL